MAPANRLTLRIREVRGPTPKVGEYLRTFRTCYVIHSIAPTTEKATLSLYVIEVERVDAPPDGAVVHGWRLESGRYGAVGVATDGQHRRRKRMAEVRRLLAAGVSVREVAARLDVAEQTVVKWRREPEPAPRLGVPAERRRRERLLPRARAMRQEGLTQAAIGRKLGVTASTVSNWLLHPHGMGDTWRKYNEGRKVPCPRCGGKMSEHSERCAGCRAEEGWPQRKIIAAIKAWAEEHGEPPTATDWCRSGPGHPPSSVVVAHFGRWRLGIEAAGFVSRRPGQRRPARPRG